MTRSGSALQRCGREVEMEMAMAGGVGERQHGSQRQLEAPWRLELGVGVRDH